MPRLTTTLPYLALLSTFFSFLATTSTPLTRLPSLSALTSLLTTPSGTNNSLQAVLFFDREDGATERTVAEFTDALRVVRTGSESLVHGYLVVHKMDEGESLSFNVVKSPTLRVYTAPTSAGASLSTLQYATHDGRFYSKQIQAFLKRQILLKQQKISSPLISKEQFGKLLGLTEPVVIFCGKESDPEFASYESLAKGRSYLYYHCFDQRLCTMLNLIRVDRVRELEYETVVKHYLTPDEKLKYIEKKRQELAQKFEAKEIDQMTLHDEQEKVTAPEFIERNDIGFNETLWKEFLVDKPSIFVSFKDNKIFEFLPASLEISAIRDSIKKAATMNFYMDIERAYDAIHDGYPHDTEWMAVFYPPNPSINQNVEPCKSIAELAKKMKFTNPDVKFGCFARREIVKFKLSFARDLDPNATDIYYWSYYNRETKKLCKDKIPFKYKHTLTITQSDSSTAYNSVSAQIETFYTSVRNGTHPRHYNSHPASLTYITPSSPVQNITSSDYSQWIEGNIGEKSLFLITSFGDFYQTDYLVQNILSFVEEYREYIDVRKLNTKFNDVEGIEEGEGIFLYIWKKGSDQLKGYSAKIRGVDKADNFIEIVKQYVPEVRKSEDAKAGLKSEVSEEDEDV